MNRLYRLLIRIIEGRVSDVNRHDVKLKELYYVCVGQPNFEIDVEGISADPIPPLSNLAARQNGGLVLDDDVVHAHPLIYINPR